MKTGKTYLFNMLKLYCSKAGIRYRMIDYNDVHTTGFSDDYVVNQCKMYDLIAIDSADLYMNPELYRRINNLGNTILISIKDEFLVYPFHINKPFKYNDVYADLFSEGDKIEVL